ncbi:type IV secretion system DNA-binding domain-containing protein [Acidithiobacillus ferrianus]|uniref:Type IV secretion system DNA-binding domain-containing protein n=2 Tax=Acidithiobacillus ferrianus TaxID=2678518 RepID=A0A845UDV9_9PROT|nr:type IV secretion system DNA-binding domain-containing protein [Acidithiobacillus ferrianus]NDU42064.1 type IV secretion system DNA-binding domain-containing protein [Acidithiobacillus ferrianus]
MFMEKLKSFMQAATGENGTQPQKQRWDDLSHHARAVLEAAHTAKLGRENEDQHMAGSSLVDATVPSVKNTLRRKTRPNQITLGGVPLDTGDEQQHVLIVGAPGTGKSVEIKKALRAIRARGTEKAVIYDVSGELVSLFFRPGIDHILNPLDQRSERWNPWMDAEPFEYAAFAKSLIPTQKGEGEFWSVAAQATLEALLTESQDLDELVSTGLSAPLGTLAQLVADAGFGGMIGPEKTFQSTRASMGVYLRSLGLLANVHREDAGAFSIRKWLETPGDSWLFLPVPPRARDALRPLVSLWVDTVVRHAMSLRQDPDRRIWLALDELPTLKNLPSLPPALAEGRKFGLTAILGIQAYGQLQDAFGEHLAASLWSIPKTRLYLRVGDASTADHVSKELGEIKLTRKTASASASNSTSTNGQGGGSSSSNSNSSSTNEAITTERLILPSQIMGLEDLHGYLRMGGSHRVARVKIEFDGLPRHGDQPDFLDCPQRSLPRYDPDRKPDQPSATTVGEGKGRNDPATTCPDAAPPPQEEMNMEMDVETMLEEGVMAIMAGLTDEQIANLSDEEVDRMASALADQAVGAAGVAVADAPSHPVAP